MSDEVRPVPASKAPPREALREVYLALLAVEQERLAVAVRIERERAIVFPETSVICRDVRALAERLYGAGAAVDEPAPVTPRSPVGAPGGRAPGDLDGGELGDVFDAAGEVDALLGELGQVEGLDGGAR